ITLKLAEVMGILSDKEISEYIDKFIAATETIPAVLEMDDYIKTIAEKIKDTYSAFYIGRGLDYAFACEGSLKLKEISYVNSEAFNAGELKHGTISLVTEGVPIIAVATQDHIFSKTLANVEEVKARG